MQSANTSPTPEQPLSPPLSPTPEEPCLSSPIEEQSTLEQPKQEQTGSKLTREEPSFHFSFMDYSSASKKYHLIKPKGSPDSFLKDITDLLLSYPRFHIKPVSQRHLSQSRVSGPAKVMKPVIIPVFDGKQFAFIFETSECRSKGEGDFELSDRFLIFMTDAFLPYTLSELAKTITKQEFEERMAAQQTEGEGSVEPSQLPVLSEKLLETVALSRKYYFSKELVLSEEVRQQERWYLKGITDYSILIRLNTLHYHPILLLTLLIYYAIREYKIILLGYKEHRHVMSEAMLALKAALAPIDYCYPVIFSAISDHHDNFIDSPVPCLICYWGEERDCGRVRGRYKRISEDKTMPSALIDLNSLTAFSSIASEYESKIMVNMNNYIAKQPRSSTQTAVERANSYVFTQLLNGGREELKEESLLFRSSLSFHVFEQGKPTA